MISIRECVAIFNIFDAKVIIFKMGYYVWALCKQNMYSIFVVF